VIGQFLSEMSGIEELSGVVILATTNRIDLVDPALLVSGRFDLVLELPMPDQAAREVIFGIELRRKPLSENVNVSELARATQGHSGADIAFVCRKATMLAIRGQLTNIKGGEDSGGSSSRSFDFLVERKHFETALLELKNRKPPL
jgi:transitional endoplasmic reticulum ATPase